MNRQALNAKVTAQLRKTRTHILYRCAMVLCLALGYHLGSLHHWNTDRPPTQQKLQVITYGWADKKGNWASYDNGERIEVKAWKPL